jgi:SnoaL-like protein
MYIVKEIYMDKYSIAKESVSKNLTVLRAFLDAVNNLDFKAARECVTNDLQFKGVLGEVNGADAYFEQMEKMQLKYSIHKMFSSDQDVAVFYDIKMGEHDILSAGWYSFKNDKINRIQVIFDPRKVIGA